MCNLKRISPNMEWREDYAREKERPQGIGAKKSTLYYGVATQWRKQVGSQKGTLTTKTVYKKTSKKTNLVKRSNVEDDII